MFSGLTAFLVSAGAVTLAEMGDKTQLLAMCFATRYSAKKVMLGVFAATVLNHAVAVAAGYFLREVLSSYMTLIQIAASLSFIGFALWTIRGDGVDDESEKKTSFGPVLTVAIAFFLAEMGDKTQFATVSLAARFGSPVFVLLGTTTGMLIADGLGIVFGVVMNKKIPEQIMKWVSAIVFAVCGLFGYIDSARGIMGLNLLVASTLAVILVTILIAVIIIKTGQSQGFFDKY